MQAPDDALALGRQGREVADGIVEIERSTPKLFLTIVRDPLTGVPPGCVTHRMVLARNFGRLRAYVSDPALIHEAIVRNADSLAKSGELKRVVGAALGEGLLTADGAVWRRQRHALSPPFQHERLQALVPTMIAAAEETRDRWLALPEGADIDIGHEMMGTTFRIIVDTMLSGAEGFDAARFGQWVADGLSATSWGFALAILKAPLWTPYPGKRRTQAATRLMRQTVMRGVAARRRAGAVAADRIDDLMDMLLAAVDPDTGDGMSDETITDNILTFVTAGHETTALALSWTFALLAENPACLARLEAEIASVVGDGPVRPESIGALAYTRQVVSEAMRLYPPAPVIARAVERDVEVGGVALPAGSMIFVPIHALHRHRGLWDRPEAFDPDRFAPEAVKARHRFAYMPFGAGPRICIGSTFAMLEAVTILAVLAKAVRLERIAPMPTAIMQVTLRPKAPLRLRVKHSA